MIQRFLLLFFLLGWTESVLAQKMAYIPSYLLNTNDVNGAQFTWSKTAQSANFTLIWGNTVGTNPVNYPDPDLRFDPAAILDTMEYIYTAFKQLGFVDDAPGTKLSQYKVPVVIYNTWGANGSQGWANGGDADGVVGAFWAHPNAMHDGGVAAHEFAHSLQAQSVIDYRSAHGLGYVWNNAGIFWETHANFMRNILYPKSVSAWGMDVYHTETFGDWKNTYENYELLFAIMESEGIDMINRLWRESFSGEYPLQAYKRLAGYNQAELNDSLFQYARRMATFDFKYNNVGKYFRQYRTEDLSNYLFSIQACYSILKNVPGAVHRYEIPIELAPEEFAYNVIPLYPESDSCAVIIKFKGHTEANTHAGWRYGFVAAHPNGTISRYSPTYSENTREINFRLQGDEAKLYLVVMGAPFDQITTNTTNDTWKGYPKHFRYPYELNISGAVPEGFQAPANFRAQLKSGGHLHSNGGGWIQNTATVANTVYVGPSAMVLGGSNLSGQVRLENTALVKNATLSGQVRILNNAFVDGGTYSGSAIVQGQGFAENVTMTNNALIGMRAKVTNYKLSGTVEVGGDVVVYNETGNCNNGVYYRLTNYYDNKLLECDGRTASHQVNKDVNSTYALFSNETMASLCQCTYETSPILVDSIAISPVSCQNTSAGSVLFYISKSCGPFQYAWSNGAESGTNLSGLSSGQYKFSITDALGRQVIVPIEILAAPVLNASVSRSNYDCTLGIGGEAYVAVLSGAWPITYAWNTGDNGTTITDLAPGWYAVTTTDAQGCTFSDSVQVGLSGQLNTSLLIAPISCHDQSDGSAVCIPLNGKAPYTWLWKGGETYNQITALSSGDYGVTLTDVFGCMDQQQFSITAPQALNLTLQGPTTLCPMQTGTISATATGGILPYQFEWSNNLAPDTLIIVQGSGSFMLTVTDAHGCTLSQVLEIAPGAPLTLASVITPIQCFGSADGTAAIQAINGTAPFHWLWASGQTDSYLTDLSSGLYAATVTDALGCINTIHVSLSDPLLLSLQTDAQEVRCFGTADGMAWVAVSGGTAGYTYFWNNQQVMDTIKGLTAGTYSVTVSDMHGCSAASTEIIVHSPSTLSIQVDAPAILCPAMEGKTTANTYGGTPPYSYQWSTGATGTELISMAGLYIVSVTDTHDCQQTQAIDIQEATPVTILTTIQAATSAFASDGAIEVTDISGDFPPYNFLWSNGATSQSIENTAPGEYTLIITDAAGCIWVFTRTVSFESAAKDLRSSDIKALIIPNPSAAVAELSLEIPQAQHLTIRISDAYGRVLYAKTDFFQNKKGVVILPGNFVAGLYWVRVLDEAGKELVIRWLVI